MRSLSCRHKLVSIALWSPWAWIALLYAGQTLSALLISMVLRLDTGEIGPSVWLLAAGTVHAAVVGLRSDATVSSKQDWVPALLYAAFIFSTSQRSFEGVEMMPIDVNFFHPVEYAVLAIFFCWMGRPVVHSQRAFPLLARVILGGLAFAALDEFHQSFIPNRTATMIDLVFDFIGLWLGCGIFFTGRYLRRVLKTV